MIRANTKFLLQRTFQIPVDTECAGVVTRPRREQHELLGRRLIEYVECDAATCRHLGGLKIPRANFNGSQLAQGVSQAVAQTGSRQRLPIVEFNRVTECKAI